MDSWGILMAPRPVEAPTTTAWCSRSAASAKRPASTTSAFLGDGEIPWPASYPTPALNLYGTAVSGGLFNGGIVFKLDSLTQKETVLYNFGAQTETAAVPTAGLFEDANGNFFGTTAAGGAVPAVSAAWLRHGLQIGQYVS